jgi:hypothetical protein
MSLNGYKRRLSALESTCGIGDGDECPQCGQRDPRPGDTYEIEFLDDLDDEPEDEWCPACGRPTSYAIRFEDDPDLLP